MYYRKSGRHDLPWRTTHDPYRILVSEIMLQQTQVERVIPFYRSFLKRFPTVRALAQAPLGDVLKAWQGLGYNRRAKMLHEAAKLVVKSHKGKVPVTILELEALPGVGPYTARAVAAFAANVDSVFVETNLRTAVIHHFFADREGVHDKEILEVLTEAYPKGRAREWYAALMDYGAHLKRSGARLNARSKGYVKQSTFAGSDREARGAILKSLTKAPATRAKLLKLLGGDRKAQIESNLSKLLKEEMVVKTGAYYRLP
ncbi:MAG: A/G-specific adenine glycosylase [Patescibacteria group bacterium]